MDIEKAILAGELSLPPARLRMLTNQPAAAGRSQPDGLIEAEWDGRCARFAAEINKLATPKVLQQAVAMARDVASPPETYPMVVVPYLSPSKLLELEAAQVSGLDLCGNGVLVVPGRMLVFRSGGPNRFPQSAKLRNVYRGMNSLVARAFLLRPRFAQVKEILGLLQERGGTVVFSTVSKALRRLEEDLTVSRQGNSIRLLQPDLLMDNLVANYEPPAIAERFRGKCSLPGLEVVRRLVRSAETQNCRLILTGAASNEKYAAMAGEPVVSLYSTIPPDALLGEADLGAQETDRFANLEILRTDDARAFFDARIDGRIPYASPIQAWLELAAGDKRQKDAAEQVRRGILESLDTV